MTTFEKTWQFGINYVVDSTSALNAQKNQFWWFKAFLKGDLPQRNISKLISGNALSHVEVGSTTQDNQNQGLWWCLASSDGSSNAGTTTITSGSNGVTLNGASTINVSATAAFSASGVLYVQTSTGVWAVSYTGTSGGNSFTGCVAPNATGTMSTGGGVYDGQDRWGLVGDTQLWRGGNSGSTNSGSSASFTSGATIVGAVRMTGLANMTANDVGNYMTITGSDGYNLSPTNTPFKIVNYISATSVDIYNPWGQTSDSHNGSISWSERNPYYPPGVKTTIASGSNNVTLPTGTINVASTTGFNSSGTIFVLTNAGFQTVTYSGTSGGNQFTGCTGGTGTMATSNAVVQVTYGTMVPAASGTNHSWMILGSPMALGPYYYTLDWNNSSGQISSFSISKSVPTGGSSTTAPTSSDTTTLSAFTWNSGQTSNFIHGMLSTDGYFITMNSRSGGGTIETITFFQLLANAKSGDSYPFVYWNKFNNNSEAMNVFTNSSGAWAGRNFNGTSQLTGLTPVYATYNSSNAVMALGTSTGDLIFTDFVDGQYDDLPFYIVNISSGAQTLKGRLVDIRQAPSLVTGFTEPNPASPQSICIGGTWFPCNLPFIW